MLHCVKSRFLALPTPIPSPITTFMNLNFIPATAGAHVVCGEIVHFGNPHDEAHAAINGSIVAPLGHLALLRAAGADADGFLQGQLSNDLRKLTAGHAQMTSYSNPKGRMLAVFHLSRDPQGAVLMEVHRSVAESALKRLKMFVLRAKVDLQDISADTAALGLAGPDAESILRGLGLPTPAATDAVEIHDDIQITRRPAVATRFTLRASPTKLSELWPQLTQQARPAGTAAWRLLDIEAGVAVVYPETQEHFVAQMANLEQRGGISFDKGCYTGQEVIARLHYLGALKRRLFVAQADAEAIAPGTAIHAEGGDQTVGEVVDAAPAAQNGAQRLSFVLQLAHTGSILRIGSPDGATLSQVAAAD